jgi:hypothetical protein
MHGDLPGVPPRVRHHAATVPIGHVGRLLDRGRPGREGAPVRGVGVVDVDVEKGPYRATLPDLADHDHRIADPDLGWQSVPIPSRGAEHVRDELDELIGAVSHDAWRDRVPAARGGRRPVRGSDHRIGWR